MGSARGVRRGFEALVSAAALALAAGSSASAQLRTLPTPTPAEGGSGAAESTPSEAPATPEQRDVPEPEHPPEPAHPDLFPRTALARAAGWLLPKEPAPAPSSAEDRGEEALDRYFDDTLEDDRLASGRADGWYGEAQQAMRRRFRVDGRELIRERRAGMTPLQRLTDELRRYARGNERPQDPQNAPPPDVLDGQYSAEDQAGLRYAEHVNLLNGPANWYRVDIRVVHSPEGVVQAAWVIRSSGYATLDRAALQAVRDGSLLLPPPPARLVGDRQAIASEWAFEAADVATYWGQMGCVDDPVGGGVTCTPGDGRGLVRTRVRLLRVVDAEHPTFEERRRDARDAPPRLRD